MTVVVHPYDLHAGPAQIGRPVRAAHGPRSRASRSRVPGAWMVLALLVTAAPSFASTLFGLIDTGELFSSADDGVTWTPLSTLPVRDAAALAARLSASDLFLASRAGSVYRSQDGGASWTAVGAIAASDVVDLGARTDGSLLVLTATGSLYRSADLGASFSALASLTGPDFVSLAYAGTTSKWYSLTRTGEVYESADQGIAWTPKGAIATSDAQRIRTLGSTLYVLTGTGDVYRSTDAAASWTAVGTLSQAGMMGLVRNGSALAAASREGHVATSADGAGWTWRGSMNQLTLTALATDEPVTTGVDEAVSTGVRLGPPYPNPSSGPASFALRLESNAEVTLVLHDMAGRVVARRAPQPYEAGWHVASWSPGVTRTGLYFLEIRTDAGLTATRRWVLVR
jgi:hypothetical protein